ncbi:MAG: hypothetical protein R3D25_08455 [Geminicoccaceae bacterium]
MIICICNVLRERECREAAAHPETRNAGCVYRRLGCRVRCGACVTTMQEIVSHMRETAPRLPESESLEESTDQ